MAAVVKQRAALLESIKHVQTALAVFGPSSWLKASAFVVRQASLPVFSVSSALKANPFVVRGGKNGGRPRPDWREIEYAQAALGVLYPEGPPRGVTLGVLDRKVNRVLAADPNFIRAGFREVSPRTTRRALKLLSSK